MGEKTFFEQMIECISSIKHVFMANDEDRGSKVLGRSNFQSQTFHILIANLDLLQKSSIFYRLTHITK